MNLDFLTPVSEALLEGIEDHGNCLGQQMEIHLPGRLPDLDGVKVAFLGVLEDRLDVRGPREPFNFLGIRYQLYRLHPGNWDIKLADLGDIEPGETVEDTYFALRETVAQLIKMNVLPVVLGGSQDLMYAQYRAYDQLEQMVNIVNVDARFDLGDVEAPIRNNSFMGKIVVDKPYNLSNYTSIGYQTYFNSQDEIDLIEKLFFDACRLGEVTAKMEIVEPLMRDADLVGIDLGAVNAAALGNPHLPSPNGFDGKELCALARYAGISDKVSSFGIFEYTAAHNYSVCNMLVAQALWYFVEGVNYRRNEYSPSTQENFTKYQVPIDDEVLVFYKSPLSGRWWIEIPIEYQMNNNLTRNTLLPCTEEEYLDACNQIMPERWYKTKRKNMV